MLWSMLLRRVGTIGLVVLSVTPACSDSEPAADGTTTGGATELTESSGALPSTSGTESETSSSEGSSSSGGPTSSSEESSSGTSSSSGDTSSSTGPDGPASCNRGGTELPDLIGEWVAVAPLFPASPDTLVVLGDGQVTASFGYDDGAGQAQVELTGYFVIDGDAQSLALDCGEGCELAFATSCCFTDDLLLCAPAADWYHVDEIVYERVQ
jgi:hypothetical protein